MRYFKTVIVFMAVAAFVLAGCKKTEHNLTVNPERIEFTADGGEHIVTVQASEEWAIDNTADWLKAIPANDGESFTLTARENESEDIREAKVIVSIPSISVEVCISQEGAKKGWSVAREAADWKDDIKMKEVFPGVWISPKVDFDNKNWKIRWDGSWDNGNIGCGTISKAGDMGQGIFNGDYIRIAEKEGTVVYNANNGTIGTLVWGLSTSTIKSLSGVKGYDYPMAHGPGDLWYSLPVELAAGDVVTAHNGVQSVKLKDVSEGGVYIVEGNVATGACNLIRPVWGVYGEFNSWTGCEYMYYAGGSLWYLFDRHYENGWKLRKVGSATEDYGGSYCWMDQFRVSKDGNSIVVSDYGLPAAGFNVVFDSSDETVSVNQQILL